MRLLDGAGNLLATSEQTTLPDPTGDLSAWELFGFPDGNAARVVAGNSYAFQFVIPDGSAWWPVINWDILQGGKLGRARPWPDRPG